MDDWAGVDFVLIEDIQADNTGDYGRIDSNENVDLSIKRRLSTPLGDLFYEETYGNGVFDELGEPMTDDWVEKVKQKIVDCLSYETRITVVSVEVEVFNEQRKSIIHIAYQYNTADENTNVIQVVTEDGGLSIS
jgi:phage baseplate assembly protein W